MKFVKTENLKIGMRLARPIYSKNGVLLFERNSLLNEKGIENIQKFGLFGIYVLEPAEPLPPISIEDIEFERFQTMTVYAIGEELERILSTRRQNKMQIIVSSIIKKFGHLEEKINFYQNLRGKEDFVYRHALNVAILCAMITHVMNVRLEEQNATICAALVHDIAKVNATVPGVYGDECSEKEMMDLYRMQSSSLDLIERALSFNVKRICMQALDVQMDMLSKKESEINKKLVMGAKILLVANRYDEITGMNLHGTAQSEVKAIQEFLNHPHIYDPQVVDALLSSIHILFPGVSIELNTGEKGLIVSENKQNILRPVILSFKDNSILDLALIENNDIQIVDIMKTMDNRYIMDQDTLQKTNV